MLSTLHLVRHGEVHNPDHVVYADLDGFGLSATGRAQAASAARRLAAEPIDVIVSSPLQRARETAAPIAAALGRQVTEDARLLEWHLGRRWAGVGWDDLPTRFPGELEAYLAAPLNLPFSPEPLLEVAERMLEVVDDLGRIHPGGVAVIVSHQDPVQAARLALTARDLGTLHDDKPGHASVITLSRRDGRWGETSKWEPAEPSTPFPPVKGAEDT